MIHCDRTKFKITGTVADVAADFLEIMQELVKIGVLDPDNTTAAFFGDRENGRHGRGLIKRYANSNGQQIRR